jgi:hypothetical protein
MAISDSDEKLEIRNSATLKPAILSGDDSVCGVSFSD